MPDEPKELTKITTEDVDAVTDRLQEWIPTLGDQEQLVLSWILTRAAAAPGGLATEYAKQTQGGVPMAALLADAAGLQDVSGFAGGEESRAIVILGGKAVHTPTWTFRF